MITTSYFNKTHPDYGRMANHPDAVSVANRYRWGMVARHCDALKPGEIRDKYKNGIERGDQAAIRDYTEEYQTLSSKLNAAEIVADLGNAIQLCHEKPPEFCHRHLVADWLRKVGYDVAEQV